MIFTKICGLREVADARYAVACGADAIGLNLHPPSPRYVSVDVARDIADAVRGSARIVALCVDLDAESVREVVRTVNPDVLQFHGQDKEVFCGAFGRPYWKAVPITDGDSLALAAAAYPSAEALLVDTPSSRVAGGTGQSFDWSLIPDPSPARILLAGGLDPTNVAEAIQAVRPYGVDVASGVESRRGVKSRARIRAFLEAARGAG